MAEPPRQAVPVVVRPDTPEQARLARAGNLLWLGLALAVVARGGVWFFTMFLVGPMLGGLDLDLSDSWLVIDPALSLTAVVATGVIGTGLRERPDRFRRAGRLLGWIFAVHAVAYAVLTVVLSVVEAGWQTWPTLTVVCAASAGLLWIALAVIRLTGRDPH